MRPKLKLVHTKKAPSIPATPAVLREVRLIAKQYGETLEAALGFLLSVGLLETKRARRRRERRRLLAEIEARGGFTGPVRDEQRPLSRALDTLDVEIRP